MENKDRRFAAWLTVPVVALNAFYASQGGISPTPAVAWLLTFGTAAGAGLVWLAAHRGPWLLAWPGLALLALPPALAWPEIGLSIGGWVALAILAAAAVAIAGASLARRPGAHQQP